MIASALAFLTTFRTRLIAAGIGLLIALSLIVVVILDVRHRESLAATIAEQRTEIAALKAVNATKPRTVTQTLWKTLPCRLPRAASILTNRILRNAP